VVDAVEQHRNDLGHGLFGARFPRVLAWIAKGFDPDIGKQMAETVAGAFGYAFFGPAVLAGVDFEPGDGCPVRLYVLEFLG
jgi:hypothetical protein